MTVKISESEFKKRLEDGAKIIYNLVGDMMNCKQTHFPSGLVAHNEDDVLLRADIEGWLDEARKEFLEMWEKGYEDVDLYYPWFLKWFGGNE